MTYYFDHLRIVEYVLHANGVQTTHRDVSTTSVQRYMSNHHVNATIASKITSYHSFKSYGRGRTLSENSLCGFNVDFAPE